MHRSFIRSALIVLGLALSGCQSPATPNAVFELQLEKYAGELKVIKLEKDGEVYSFLYDTGGGYTILDPAYTRTFGCTPYGKTVGFRLSGEQVESRNCNPVSFDFGEFSVTTAPKVMAINSFLPEGLPELAGAFSLQTFQHHLVTIDYSEGLLTIESPGSFHARTRDMSEIPLKVTSELDGESVAMFTQVLEIPVPLWFYMDSGNLRGVLLAPHVAKLLELENGSPLTLQIAGQAYERTGDVIDMIYDGALDIRFFKAHRIALDLQNSRAWVKRNASE